MIIKTKLIALLLLLIPCLSTFGQKQAGSTEGISEKGLVKISIMYPFAEGKTFDMEYYQTRHMPMVAGFLGSNLVKYTIEKGTASGIPNTPLPFLAIGTFYVKSLSEYQQAIAPNREAIRSDFPNYTNASPIIFISEVIR
ncbi:EthD family reductase [Algoriphagus namhaensis]